MALSAKSMPAAYWHWQARVTGLGEERTRKQIRGLPCLGIDHFERDDTE
jgi:hypothetical protein